MLEWINIKNYKCFNNFEVKDLKRINLITGKNNIGKSAFLEAVTIHLGSFNFGKLNKVISFFYNKRYSTSKPILLYKMIKSFSINSNINNIVYYINQQDYTLIANGNKLTQQIENTPLIDTETSTPNIKFLQIGKTTESSIVGSYSIILLKDKEDEVNKLIRDFDKSIIKFQVIQEKAFCSTKDNKRSINEFGAGLKDYIFIICSLLSCQDGYLFIDEIENGLHYTQLNNLWKIIFKLSKELNVQVFITTHSKECLESYSKTANDMEENDISLIEIVPDKKRNLYSINLDKEIIETELKQEHGLRGW